MKSCEVACTGLQSIAEKGSNPLIYLSRNDKQSNNILALKESQSSRLSTKKLNYESKGGTVFGGSKNKKIPKLPSGTVTPMLKHVNSENYLKHSTK